MLLPDMRKRVMDNSLFSAESPEELLSLLQKNNISHPPVEVGATKEQIERCVCFRFLSTYVNESRLTFPLKLVHADRPDFRLIMNSRTIGVECTQALSEQFARALSLRQQYCPDIWIDLSDFRWSCPDRTSEDILALLKKNRLTGEPWHGDTVDHEWALAMKACIDVKTDRLNAEGFLRYDDNWLLIDDDFIPQSIVDPEKSLSYLMPEIRKYFASECNSRAKFNEIAIRHREDLARVTQTTFDVKPINDLW